ncbi:MAG: hypothetical protein ACK5Z5_09105 [Neisseriaceae bacterium]
MLQTISISPTPAAKAFGDPGDPDILFYMEYGTYLRMASNFTLSDLQLAKAQKVVDKWIFSWKNTTGGNLATTSTQLLLNDSATDYQPKGYEKTMLATYRALNHIDNNNWDNARVEIKKMYEAEQAIANYNQALYMKAEADAIKLKSNKQGNQIYTAILQKYDFSDINSPQVLALKNSYQNAFSHYLAGFVFEALHEHSLSRPGYLKSGELAPLNKLPRQSIDNLDYGNTSKPGYANVLIIQEVGHAPQIQSQQFHIPFIATINNQRCLTNINIFFPKLVPDKSANHDFNYTIDGKSQNQELFTNFDLMAARNLHDIMPHIITRNITSAIRDIGASVASCSAGGTTGDLLNITSMITGMLLDRADERAWVLLSSKVYLNRVQLPLGTHTFTIFVNGKTYTQTFSLFAPYQIIDMRILGDKFYFNTQPLPNIH